MKKSRHTEEQIAFALLPGTWSILPFWLMLPLIRQPPDGAELGESAWLAGQLCSGDPPVLRKYSIWDELTPWRDRRRAVA